MNRSVLQDTGNIGVLTELQFIILIASIILGVLIIMTVVILVVLFYRRKREAVTPTDGPVLLKEASRMVADKALSQLHPGPTLEDPACHQGGNLDFTQSHTTQQMKPVLELQHPYLHTALPPSTQPVEQEMSNLDRTRLWDQEGGERQPAITSAQYHQVVTSRPGDQHGSSGEYQSWSSSYHQQPAAAAYSSGFAGVQKYPFHPTSMAMMQGGQQSQPVHHVSGVTFREATPAMQISSSSNVATWQQQGVDPNLLVQRLLASGQTDAANTVMLAAGMDAPAPRQRLAPIVGYPTVPIYPISQDYSGGLHHQTYAPT
ncbi:hypothetical protein CEUSTIGMA_g6069.t1 [Chlamydomonas eustigma]|uniref:Uncharacterized protein n=1 Tax=Chlamydomonas eustigma TaxID=1157962 RepID=A0A250X6C8_9CHLO|nr:hypothetical protein CEUSTIGMA_g6069.t1 [Chlamydomonas eustigma]|eukprot:GAX78631.1 hypothetical protein CEUSTIGMA_g6069.t1 [Chlamydomonas eustigma]